MRASEDALDALHAALAKTMLAELKAAKASDEPIPAALLSAVAKFLKDNGIDAPSRNTALGDLARELGDLDLDEAALDRPN